MTVDQYIEQLPEDRKEAVHKLRKIFLEKLPNGFEETIGYGMIAYVVPHGTYPAGYHCDPKQPLPFINIASQKGHLAIYHMGLYANPDMLVWFEHEFSKVSKSKADMGKSCLRFKKMENIPYQLIEELAAKISVEDWISTYERLYKKASKK
jgi:uncharacterized protein YdhG (YjbR/CyaY superfamily)